MSHWAGHAIQTGAFKVEALGRLPPVEYMNWSGMVLDGAPPVLWAALPMASSTTGMRPEGDSVRLHGVWWKLEPLNDARIQQDMALNAMPFDGMTYASDYAWEKKKEDPRRALQKAIHDAIRAGIGRGEMIDMIDNHIVVTVMTD